MDCTWRGAGEQGCCVVRGWLPRSGGERIDGQKEKGLLEMAVGAGVRTPCVRGDLRAEQRGASGGPSFSEQHVDVHRNRSAFQYPPPRVAVVFFSSREVEEVGDRFHDVYSQVRHPWRRGGAVFRRARLPGESWRQTTSS